ncbi:MAG TPA: sigma-54-dependent Fis family transcriptional regulator, partial [Rhodospirillaceae bacterium]|nr:sigma-54-dependent Fis family transcriptional regulator [Rhodospirillaceae bacterium]
MSAKTILIIDDEDDIRSLLKDILEDEGYKVLQAAHSMQAEHVIDHHNVDLLILDIWLENSDKDGIELLRSLRKTGFDKPVLMISGHGNVDTAVQTIKLGAYDFIEKP